MKFAVSPDAVNYSWTGIKGLTDSAGRAGTLAFYTAATNTSADSSTERMRITSNGNVGIGTGTSAPLSNLHIQETDTGATATTYAHMILEDVDAQMDLTSSESGDWGSAINFKEHYASNTSANDIWSIARKTTNGSGDSSLNFNFGTANNHENTTRQKFHADGRINASGSIESEGGSLRASSSELLQRRVTGWSVPLQDVIQSRFATNLGDYVYLKAPGNSTNQHGILLVGDNSLYYGRTSIETGGVANSTEAPLNESVAFKITQDGDARFTTRVGICLLYTSPSPRDS